MKAFSNNHPSVTARAGFTLIELLVVIAIIAILASILFPVFTSARESSFRSACANNLKQWGMAAQLYADDWNDVLPREGNDDLIQWRILADPSNNQAWFNVLPPYVGQPPMRTFTVAQREVFYNRGTTIHTCRSAVYSSPPRFGNGDFVVFNYAINSYLDTNSAMPVPPRRLNIPHPSRTPLFLDVQTSARELGQDSTKLGTNRAQGSGPNGRMSSRHNGGANICFVDGSMRYYKFRDAWPLLWDPLKEGLW